MGKVKVKNLSTFIIGINLPNVRFCRDLQPKQEMTLPEDVFDEFNYDSGCQSFIRDGFLKVTAEDEETAAEVSVQPRATTAETVDVKKLLTEGSAIELIKVVKEDISPALKEEIIQTALALKVTDLAKCNVLKKYLGFDCLEAVRMSIQ